MHSFWQAITWFGDSGFLLPTALLIALWLFVDTSSRAVAAQWVLLFGACGFIVMLSKIAFMGWGLGSASLNFTGFSGHTALATSVWPVLLWVATSRLRPRPRLAAAAMGWCLAVGIGMSRLALEVHSNSEVVAGALLGTLASMSFLWLQRSAPLQLWGKRWMLLGAAGLMAALMHGRPAPTQGALEVLSARLAGIDKPFTRRDLLQKR
jgi:membrane-associated phospholipid phosphatase